MERQAAFKRYDIFSKLADGQPMWVCAEENLTEAIAQMKQFARETGLEHFLYDQSVQGIVATSPGGERLVQSSGLSYNIDPYETT
jgi:hypothetical protein